MRWPMRALVVVLMVGGACSDEPRPAAQASSSAPERTAAYPPALLPSFVPDGLASPRLEVDPVPEPWPYGVFAAFYGEVRQDNERARLLVADQNGYLTVGASASMGTLAGRQTLLYRSPDDPAFTAVQTMIDGHPATVSGYLLSDEELVGVIDHAHRAGQPARWEVSDLPAGLHLVASGEQAATSVDYSVVYGQWPSEGEGPAVALTVTSDALVPRNITGGDPSPRPTIELATVGGVPAVVVDESVSYGHPVTTVEWQYSATLVARIVVSRYDTETALRIAESVGAAPPDAWRALPCVVPRVARECNTEQIPPA